MELQLHGLNGSESPDVFLSDLVVLGRDPTHSDDRENANSQAWKELCIDSILETLHHPGVRKEDVDFFNYVLKNDDLTYKDLAVIFDYMAKFDYKDYFAAEMFYHDQSDNINGRGDLFHQLFDKLTAVFEVTGKEREHIRKQIEIKKFYIESLLLHKANLEECLSEHWSIVKTKHHDYIGEDKSPEYHLPVEEISGIDPDWIDHCKIYVLVKSNGADQKMHAKDVMDNGLSLLGEVMKDKYIHLVGDMVKGTAVWFRDHGTEWMQENLSHLEQEGIMPIERATLVIRKNGESHYFTFHYNPQEKEQTYSTSQ